MSAPYRQPARPRKRELLYALVALALAIIYGTVGTIDYADELNRETHYKDARASLGAPCTWIYHHGGPTPDRLACVNADLTKEKRQNAKEKMGHR